MFLDVVNPPPIDYIFDVKIHLLRPDLGSIANEGMIPFPLLSLECTDIIHRIIDHHQDKITSSHRIPSFIRGLGYESSFLRDVSHHPSMLQLLHERTGLTIIPHYLLSNVAHINIGVPNGKPVDGWHYDSVPYVMIIMIADPNDFDGGVLEYEKDGTIHPVRFHSKGEAIFMKGSEIRHHVTNVVKGKRITLINSYMEFNFNIRDCTIMNTFRSDPRHEIERLRAELWYACHKVLHALRSTDNLQDLLVLRNSLFT